MGAFLFLLFPHFLSVILPGINGMQYQQLWSKAVVEFDGKIASSFFLLRTNGTVISCQDRCLHDNHCMSYFYNRFTGACQTHEVVFFNPEDRESSTGSRYYRPFQEFCPSQLGYIYNRALDLCYKFHYSTALYYSYASQVCNSEDGRLVIADNIEKLYHLGRTIRASTFPDPVVSTLGFRVGASDKQTEGQWRWSDGQTLPTAEPSYWCPGKPNDAGSAGEDYVAIQISNDRPGCLNDVGAMDPKYFICEIPM